MTGHGLLTVLVGQCCLKHDLAEEVKFSGTEL